jgi:hypothetical protein
VASSNTPVAAIPTTPIAVVCAAELAKALIVQRAENRHHRQRTEGDDRERHQRDECRVAQRAGGGKAPVRIEPPQRIERESAGGGRRLPQHGGATFPGFSRRGQH